MYSVQFFSAHTTFELSLGFDPPLQAKFLGHKRFLFVVLIVSLCIFSISVSIIILCVLLIVICFLLVVEFLSVGFVYSITFDGYSQPHSHYLVYMTLNCLSQSRLLSSHRPRNLVFEWIGIVCSRSFIFMLMFLFLCGGKIMHTVFSRLRVSLLALN